MTETSQAQVETTDDVLEYLNKYPDFEIPNIIKITINDEFNDLNQLRKNSIIASIIGTLLSNFFNGEYMDTPTPTTDILDSCVKFFELNDGDEWCKYIEYNDMTSVYIEIDISYGDYITVLTRTTDNLRELLPGVDISKNMHKLILDTELSKKIQNKVAELNDLLKTSDEVDKVEIVKNISLLNSFILNKCIINAD